MADLENVNTINGMLLKKFMQNSIMTMHDNAIMRYREMFQNCWPLQRDADRYECVVARRMRRKSAKLSVVQYTNSLYTFNLI